MAICPDILESRHTPNSQVDILDQWPEWMGSIVIGTHSGAGFINTLQANKAIRKQIQDDSFEEILLDSATITDEHKLALSFRLQGTEELVRHLLPGLALQTAIKAGLFPGDITLTGGRLATKEQLEADQTAGKVSGIQDYPVHGQLFRTITSLVHFAEGLDAKTQAQQPARLQQPLPVTVT